VLKNAILLAAGSGSRLAPLTDACHKSLLPIAGKPALQMIVDAVLAAGAIDVVVVTGHRHADIEAFMHRNYGSTVRCVLNERYKQDVNILSVDLGVDALSDPALGYIIIETDLVMEPRGWNQALDVRDSSQSFWVTRGRYSAVLTGGALSADASNRVEEIVYRPQYDPACEGWEKLLGILYVGSSTVPQDRKIRKIAMRESIAQYYMMPWVRNIDRLPCFSRDLGEIYAVSYNDVSAYRLADEEYARILKGERSAC